MDRSPEVEQLAVAWLAGMKAGEDVFIALDVASSELWAGAGRYVFKKSGEPDRTSDQMVRLYEDWLREYPIASIEDGLAEGDWEGWKTLTRELGHRVQLVGDDVFVTNPEILKRGIEDGVGNPNSAKMDGAMSTSDGLLARNGRLVNSTPGTSSASAQWSALQAESLSSTKLNSARVWHSVNRS